MGKCFDGSQDAYRRGDGALAKKLSEEGKAHQAEMNRLHKEAARWVYNGECDSFLCYHQWGSQLIIYCAICLVLENNKVRSSRFLSLLHCSAEDICSFFRTGNPEKSTYMVYSSRRLSTLLRKRSRVLAHEVIKRFV